MSLKSWAMRTDAAPEYAGISSTEGRVNGGSIDVDFSDDALYAPYTRKCAVALFDY
jgi:hypothetical protein